MAKEIENLEEKQEEKQQNRTKSASWVMAKNKADLDYKTQMNLLYKYKIFENFRIGDQWPPVTPETADWPRPVFNIVQYIENHKVSAVMNENIAMVFSNQEGDMPDMEIDGQPLVDSEKIVEMADNFTKFAASTWENIKQRQLNEKLLHTSANKGLGILHYFWDALTKGGRKLKYIGDLKGESLNPANVGFGNPQSLYVQDQPFILIRSRESIAKLKKEAKAENVPLKDLMLLVPDRHTNDNPYDAAQTELDDGEGKANTYLIYFKEDVFETKTEMELDPETGEEVPKYYTEMKPHVFYQKVACGVNIGKAKDTELPVYPIAIMPWNEREECIYGVGDAEWLINNQRIINLLLALQVLSVQLTGFPRLVYKADGIRKETISNAMGAMIEDISKQPGLNSIDYLKPGPISPYAQELTDNFMQYTKTLLGANESSTGELSKAGQMNATAIALLQKASGVPIEGIKGRFYQCMEDVGRIWEAFFKVKYNTARLFNFKDDDNKEQTGLFRGTDAADIDFKLKIDIGPSSDYTETFVIQSLDKFHDSGEMDLDTYLKFVPKNFVPYKEQWMKQREEERRMLEEQEKEDILSQLNPVELQAYQTAPPEKQDIIMQKLMMAKRKEEAMMQQGQPNPLNKQGSPQNSQI